MCKKVEHTGHIANTTLTFHCCTNAKCHKHISNLRYSRERQATLNITLTASHGRSIERCKRSNVRNPMQLVRSVLYPNGEQAGYLVNTGHHHRSSMDQGTDRSWTFHRIRQPYM